MMKTLILPLLIFAALVGCSSTEKRSDTPDGLFAIAQEFEAADRYELAILRYTEVKNKFPYSSFATKAELAIADVHFKAESWPEAQVSYQAFRELHPTHPQIPYVVYRIGLSFYNQVPDTVDRDLTLAHDAIAAFDEVVRRFPSSEQAADAKVKREECLKRLAGKEEYIADFYFIRGMYDSALPRYEELLRAYPDLGFDAKALARAAISARRTDQREKARQYMGLLEKKFPDSSEIAAARKEIE